ncbi:hypothetical protein FO519_001019 [Halicephalobus sp. NKZ332]|nr:hypothetical protein FO519_001019 [Halicephalobus sp. NKZ332]
MMVSVDETKSPITASDAVPVISKDTDPNSVTEIKLEPVSDDDVDDFRSTHNSSVSSDQEKNKIYYCQRCLNHNLKFQRKGHKPDCRYATCTCALCLMVEQRRQINYELSLRKAELNEEESTTEGKRIRSPKCARCSAHGKKQALRGHKKILCPFNKCTCDLCGLVESRRMLMARQIRIRRNQRKQQDKTSQNESPDNSAAKNLPPLPKLNPLLISKPPLAKPTPIHVSDSSLAGIQVQRDQNPVGLLGHSEGSAFKQPYTVPSLQQPQMVPPTMVPTQAVQMDLVMKHFHSREKLITLIIKIFRLMQAQLAANAAVYQQIIQDTPSLPQQLCYPSSVSISPLTTTNPSFMIPMSMFSQLGNAFLPLPHPGNQTPPS